MVSYKINLIWDFVLVVAFAICAVSGFYLRSFGRDFHVLSGEVLVGVVLVHLIFHWNYIKGIFVNGSKK